MQEETNKIKLSTIVQLILQNSSELVGKRMQLVILTDPLTVQTFMIVSLKNLKKIEHRGQRAKSRLSALQLGFFLSFAMRPATDSSRVLVLTAQQFFCRLTIVRIDRNQIHDPLLDIPLLVRWNQLAEMLLLGLQLG